MVEVDRSICWTAGAREPRLNASLSRGLSSFDLRHNFVGSFHYDLPTLHSEGLIHAMASGWAVAGIARFTTGLPVTLINNNDTSLLGTIPNGINNNGVDTPEWSGQSLKLNMNPRGAAAVFDASQLTLPSLGTVGNARRRFFSGPGIENFDATVSRSFLVKDDRSLEFRAEAFQPVQPCAIFWRGSGRGKYFERELWTGCERDASAADAGGAEVSILRAAAGRA